MNVFTRNIKKALFTLVLFVIVSTSAFADCTLNPELPGCPNAETDIPLDSQILVLLLFVGIFAIKTLNKNTKSVFRLT